MAWTDQNAERFAFDSTIAAGDTLRLGAHNWRAFAAPGHDMGALMFFCEEQRVLISGDALWENGLGAIWPEEAATRHIDAALETLAQIRELNPGLVIPGHGSPFTDVSAAIERAESRMHAFAQDPRRVARHVVKVMFVFALLDKQRMSRTDIPAYFDRVGCYGDLNSRFLKLTLQDLAEMIVDELTAANAIRLDEDWIYPTMAA